jgi:hypothetical protein
MRLLSLAEKNRDAGRGGVRRKDRRPETEVPPMLLPAVNTERLSACESSFSREITAALSA